MSSAVTGVFKPNYCPSIIGCRGTVLFNDNNIITLNDANICIVVNNTAGGRIWLVIYTTSMSLWLDVEAVYVVHNDKSTFTSFNSEKDEKNIHSKNRY